MTSMTHKTHLKFWYLSLSKLFSKSVARAKTGAGLFHFNFHVGFLKHSIQSQRWWHMTNWTQKIVIFMPTLICTYNIIRSKEGKKSWINRGDNLLPQHYSYLLLVLPFICATMSLCILQVRSSILKHVSPFILSPSWQKMGID